VGKRGSVVEMVFVLDFEMGVLVVDLIVVDFKMGVLVVDVVVEMDSVVVKDVAVEG